MKNLTTKLSAIALCTVFASTLISYASMDTGLGNGLGGAVINGTSGGFTGMTTGDGTADLNFNGDSWVKWNSLNLNNGETLNFNAVDGANGLTILNTVSGGMSKIYGNINSNEGIAKLIISNPNGVLFDGAHFTAAGDVMVTTAPMNATFDDNGKMNVAQREIRDPNQLYFSTVSIKDSDFSVGGEYNILSPMINVANSHFTVGKGLKLTTLNGMDYARTWIDTSGESPLICTGRSISLDNIDVNGDVEINQTGGGLIEIRNGGNIDGNLTVNSDDSVALNYHNNGEVLYVTGDVDVNANGVLTYLRNANVDGNLNMKNGGGFLEVKDVNVGKDMNLTTTAESENRQGYKHFIHVNGDTTVGGNATINAKDNIHIGNYNYEQKKLLDGSFNVGGDLVAHSQYGHVMVTVDTTAGNKMELTSDNLNVLVSDGVTLTAKEYQFSSKGYIGGIGDYTDENGKKITKDEKIIYLMENYEFLPDDTKFHSDMHIAGGKISKLDCTNARIASYGDVVLTGANANDINLTAYRKRIDITGPDVHARNINIGPETDYLKVDFEGRD
ncbi:filamentous hemagglutinin N-terminal domain-containing protein, partial [bacterium]|nr:filamentous hemagglutinin N-terminal domain-containing protein [bacterium]